MLLRPFNFPSGRGNLWHRLLESGCKDEDCMLQEAERLKHYLTLFGVIGVRLMHVTYLARVQPDVPDTEVFSAEEVNALHIRMTKTCGRDFTPAEIDLIRALLTVPKMNRARLSREVCKRLGWRRDNGALKDMSCRVALLRMQTDRVITLPAPRNPKPVTYRSYPQLERAVLKPPIIPSIDLVTLIVEPVLTTADSRLWNTYIERYHYRAHQLMPGSQMR